MDLITSCAEWAMRWVGAVGKPIGIFIKKSDHFSSKKYAAIWFDRAAINVVNAKPLIYFDAVVVVAFVHGYGGGKRTGKTMPEDDKTDPAGNVK